VPDQFKLGREVIVDGRYEHGAFVARAKHPRGPKCPSKYAPAKS